LSRRSTICGGAQRALPTLRDPELYRRDRRACAFALARTERPSRLDAGHDWPDLLRALGWRARS